MSSEWTPPSAPRAPRGGEAPHGEDLAPFGVPVDPPRGATPSSAPGRGGGTARRRDRRLLRPLWFSLPVVVLALLVAVYVLGLYLWSWSAGRAYRDGDLQGARESYRAQIPWGELGGQGWVAQYDTGTTLLAMGDVDAGVEHLEAAYGGVPRAREVAPGRIESYSYECRVRMNLALGLESQGDARMGADAPADAANLYGRASELVTPCQSPDRSQSGGQAQSGEDGQSGGQAQSGDGGEDPGEQADRAHDRLEDKQRDARGRSGQDAPAPGGSPSSGPTPAPTPTGSTQPPQASPSPSTGGSPGGSAGGSASSPTPSTGFEGETPQDRQRREELERRQREQGDARDDQYDRNRQGAPGSGW